MLKCIMFSVSIEMGYITTKNYIQHNGWPHYGSYTKEAPYFITNEILHYSTFHKKFQINPQSHKPHHCFIGSSNCLIGPYKSLEGLLRRGTSEMRPYL